MENFLIENNIKHVKSRPHHPQTNGALERYHREIHKFLYDKIKNLSEFGDNEIEEGILEYISYHNNKKKSSTKFTPNEIRNITDKDQINLVIENMIKNSKKNIIYLLN